jgi:hypothetical protein
MSTVGPLDHTYVRQTILRGIDLGPAWQGTSADLAIDQLLRGQLEWLQGEIGVRFCHERVLTYPDAGMVLGTDYEIEGDPLPAPGPLAGEPYVSLVLPFTNVASIQRLRFDRNPGSFPVAADLETVPLTQTLLSHQEGILHVQPEGSLGGWWVPAFTSGWVGMAMSGWGSWGAGSLVHAETLGVWVVDYTVGLGRIPFDVAQYAAFSTAIQVLSLAGASTALGGGLGAQSLDQDGIVERIEYGSGDYGRYSGVIKGLLAQRDICATLERLRIRYQGVKYPVY